MYDRIYTVGCFDYLHYGHKSLFSKMREMGKQIVVGIHDDASIEKLKNITKNDHQSLQIRMKNVRKFVDQVFVIPSTDPTIYLECMLLDSDNKNNACFIRADDMPDFPGRRFIESKISVQFLPYTPGVSSTLIRKKNAKEPVSDN